MKSKTAILVFFAVIVLVFTPALAQQTLLPTKSTDCGGCDCLFNQKMKVSAYATDDGVVVQITPIGCKNQAVTVTHFCSPGQARFCTPTRNFRIAYGKSLIPCGQLRIKDCDGDWQFKKAFGIRNKSGCWANLSQITAGPGVKKILSGINSRLEIKDDVIEDALRMCSCDDD